MSQKLTYEGRLLALAAVVTVSASCGSCASQSATSGGPTPQAETHQQPREPPAADASAAAPLAAAPTQAKAPARIVGDVAGAAIRARAGLAGGAVDVDGRCTGPRASGRAVLCVARGPGKGAGTAAKPFRRIQAAVAAAKSGDTIRVAAGTYLENVKLRRKTLVLLGGYSGTFTRRAPARHVSHIKGQGGDAAVVLVNAGRSRVEGFRVTGGTGNPLRREYFYLGGGFYVSEGSPTITGNLIEDNDVVSRHRKKAPENLGGGVFVENGRPTVSYNVIRRNKTGRGALTAQGCDSVLIKGNVVSDNVAVGDHGGGIYAAGADIKIEGNYVARNRVLAPEGGGWGGGILVYDKGTKAVLSGNVVTGNHAPEIGSGTFIDDGAVATLRNELIFANRCGSTGGAGLYVDCLDEKTPSYAKLYNVTIAGHRCPGKGEAIYVESSKVEVYDSVLWNHGDEVIASDRRARLTVRYTLSREKIAGEGNLTGKDPRFANAATGDFHLRSRAGRWAPSTGEWVTDDVHSPAIDAASARSGAGAEPAPNGGRRNLGAYGGTKQASRSTPN